MKEIFAGRGLGSVLGKMRKGEVGTQEAATDSILPVNADIKTDQLPTPFLAETIIQEGIEIKIHDARWGIMTREDYDRRLQEERDKKESGSNRRYVFKGKLLE